MVTETVCRNYSFPSFFMFSLCCADCTPLPFPCSLLFTHSFPLPHSSPCCISCTLHPKTLNPNPNHPLFALYLNFTLTDSLSSGSVPSFFFLSLCLSISLFSTVAALLSLPDIVARCPMSHTSAKIIRGGGGRRRSGRGSQGKKSPGREQKQECMTERKIQKIKKGGERKLERQKKKRRGDLQGEKRAQSAFNFLTSVVGVCSWQ